MDPFLEILPYDFDVVMKPGGSNTVLTLATEGSSGTILAILFRGSKMSTLSTFVLPKIHRAVFIALLSLAAV